MGATGPRPPPPGVGDEAHLQEEGEEVAGQFGAPEVGSRWGQVLKGDDGGQGPAAVGHHLLVVRVPGWGWGQG